MSPKLAVDDVYSKTSRWTMTALSLFHVTKKNKRRVETMALVAKTGRPSTSLLWQFLDLDLMRLTLCARSAPV